MCLQEELFPSLLFPMNLLVSSFHLSPRILRLNLHIRASPGEQAFRETAPEKRIPFRFSTAALKQSSGCVDSSSLPGVADLDSKSGLPCLDA